jgi:hypothetical protein
MAQRQDIVVIHSNPLPVANGVDFILLQIGSVAYSPQLET